MKKYLSFLLILATLLSTTSAVTCFGTQRSQNDVEIFTDFAVKENSNVFTKFIKNLAHFVNRLMFCTTVASLTYLYGYSKGYNENNFLTKSKQCLDRLMQGTAANDKNCGLPLEIIIWDGFKSEVNNFLSYFKGAK